MELSVPNNTNAPDTTVTPKSNHSQQQYIPYQFNQSYNQLSHSILLSTDSFIGDDDRSGRGQACLLYYEKFCAYFACFTQIAFIICVLILYISTAVRKPT